MRRRHFALIDDRLVEDTLLVRRSLGMPVLKSPEPVVEPGEALGSALRDKDGQWRMWYNFFVARDPEKDVVGCDTLLGLALSDDGIHWTKPSLGLVEEAGSKDNNIVIGDPPGNGGGWEAAIGTSPVVVDDTDEGGNWAESNGTYNHGSKDWAYPGSQFE